MSKLQLIMEIAKYLVPSLATFVGLGISLIKAIKARKEAKTEAEKQAAMNDLTNKAVVLIENAEELFDGVNQILKRQGQSAGVVKKDSVMAKLQAYALTMGYAFNEEEWSAKVDDLVAMTRKVNGK